MGLKRGFIVTTSRKPAVVKEKMAVKITAIVYVNTRIMITTFSYTHQPLRGSYYRC